MALSSSSQEDSENTQQSDYDSDSTDAESNVSNTHPSTTEEEQTTQELYRGLVSRRVDLVGDYAGNELFLIDGDSLLLRCFDDERLDFHHGLQLLHAAYNVETLLENLIKRKCNFDIVFFDSNNMLCVPDKATSTSISKYLLARAAIIRHLSESLPRTHPSTRIKIYDAWHSESFITDLRASPPYFIMAHDGAGAHNNQKRKAKQKSLRDMILFFVGRKISVALMNEVEWHDTKIMTEVLEAHRRQTTDVVLGETPKHALQKSATKALQKSTTATTETTEYLHRLRNMDHQFSERQLLAIVAVAVLLRDQSSEISELQWTTFCSKFLLHQALLVSLPLSARRFSKTTPDPLAQKFLSHLSSACITILEQPLWHEVVAATKGVACNIVDFIDGRLFLYLVAHDVKPDATSTTILREMEAALAQLLDSDEVERIKQSGVEHYSTEDLQHEKQPTTGEFAVLPFSNAVFDAHLKSVHIRTDTAHQNQTPGFQKIFREISHWHNSKTMLARKGVVPDARSLFIAARRNQRYMAEMLRYAASLTNAVGKILEPQVIFVQSSSNNEALSSAAQHRNNGIIPSKKDKAPAIKTKLNAGKGGVKGTGLNASKQAMLEKIAADNAKKVEAAGQKKFDSWREVSKALEMSDPSLRYGSAQTYLNNLRKEDKVLIGAEVELYMANCLLQHWIERCSAGNQSQHMHVAASIWNHLQTISMYPTITTSVSKAVKMIVNALELPATQPTPEDAANRKLAFTLLLPQKDLDLSVGMSAKTFLLLHCGPYLERSFNSSPDDRVDFQPDDWQRKVLDSIDDNKSIFVVAPTSAGKTFISFYAMRKVLEADDDGVLVYVAPTKALVNQIAAEIQGRYSKNFKHGGKSVWAIHSRDHRVNNPTGCQILVTVPHILQIMLLAPSNARSWSQRVKRIIFDEIHTIGQAEDGVVWEQLLLMSPCPIIGLSATVGNPDDFSQWLASTQDAVGSKLVTVQHPHRYSDLRKYYHIPPKQFDFTGLPTAAAFGGLGLDESPGVHHIHPVAALVERSRGVPEDLSLEPRDCYLLWQAMEAVAFEPFLVPENLNPDTALPEVCRKADILKWERSLKELLQSWLCDDNSPYEDLLRTIEGSFRDVAQEAVHVTSQIQPMTSSRCFTENSDEYVSSSLSLLCRLQERDALPAILFNYDRLKCEQHAQDILEQLQSSEEKQKKSGPKWAKTLEKWEEWKQWKDKQRTIAAKAREAKPGKKGKADHDDSEKLSKGDALRDSAFKDDDKWEWFDPEAPMSEYSFADYSKLQQSEVEEHIRRLRYQEVQPWLIDGLKRGIGVHHAGMPRSYRTCVEVLFRKRFLRVVVATGTLALGINMPCKTVVFSGDSVFLTALNYRQCAGRAGRRGFDLLGNVVFHGVSREKVCRLISSRLPDLNGHFPITTSLVLRLFTLLHESSYSQYSVQAVNSLLSQPRLYMGGESFKDQTMHHLRFSIEYLRRQNLLSSGGAPLNFAGLVSHLYYTENSSFAFHALLKEGYLNELCAGIDQDEDETLLTLMLVMSHLFFRRLCRQSVVEVKLKAAKPLSSVVFLPPLPGPAAEILENHNRQTLRVYETYVKTFVDQHIKDDDNALPLSGMEFGAPEVRSVDGDMKAHPSTRIRSSFVALSGHSDAFTSIHDLCTTVRSGVFLEEAVIPYMPSSDELEAPINAWLYDFYRHGDTQAIQDDNGIRKADIWFMLNDFSFVLATIVTSLSNFLKIDANGDVDILDVQADGDRVEEAKEDKVGEKEEMDEKKPMDATFNAMGAPLKEEPIKKKTKKAKVLDSWDDDDEDEEETSQMGTNGGQAASELADMISAWDIEKDGGFLKVLKAFRRLQENFNEKFKAMWA